MDKKELGKRVSPNEMLAAAMDEMLGGAAPKTRQDWMLVMNFMACNVHPEMATVGCQLLRRLYEMPLTDREVEDIVAFQTARREQ